MTLIRRLLPKFRPSFLTRIARCSSSDSLAKLTQLYPDLITDNKIMVAGKEYEVDSWTNITPKILNLMERQLHLQQHHPLSHLRQRIVHHFYSFKTYRGNPLFSVHDRINPVVTVEQNYDSLLVPIDHPSRDKADSYYINSNLMLRAHTSAHQTELIRMGLDNFLVIGDVYRRDAIDSSHYPVFHQAEGVRLMSQEEMSDLWKKKQRIPQSVKQAITVFENTDRNDYKQAKHSQDAAKFLELDLKECLVDLSKALFGKDIEYRWVDAYFPFTHPSWELEVKFGDKWMEVLGCGIVEQELLQNCGANDKIGWAFGLGLERLAMRLYQIPDIRLFWSKDSGFLNQFVTNDPSQKIVYRPISSYPQCINDISFWLPDNLNFSPNDFYDLVRSIGGDLVEQVTLFDEFEHPKKKRRSQSYRIVYRSHERTLTQVEVDKIHLHISQEAEKSLNVQVR